MQPIERYAALLKAYALLEDVEETFVDVGGMDELRWETEGLMQATKVEMATVREEILPLGEDDGT